MQLRWSTLGGSGIPFRRKCKLIFSSTECEEITHSKPIGQVWKANIRWQHRAIITLLFLRSALATQSSCRSPTEKFSPFSVTSEWSEWGSWLTWGGTYRAVRARVALMKSTIYCLITILLTISLICVFSRASQICKSEYWSHGSKLLLLEHKP